MAYLLDTDAFISAKNLHYGMDFCPAYWDWLVHAHAMGQIFSIDQDRTELVDGDDELAQWARERDRGFFLRPAGPAMLAMRQVSEWVTGQDYEPAAINTFLQAADYYLVAQALAGEHIVVTHERPGASTARVKIPDVCMGMGVQCMTPFQMLRREHARFVLQLATSGTGGR